MLAQERKRKIYELLQEDGSARVGNLSKAFNVSEPTIRQDLEKLEQDGLVIREHGGAVLKSVSQQVKSLSLQHLENMDKKDIIAAKAIEFIKNGDRIILDSGSTVTAIAKKLGGKERLTVITNALNIALIVGAEISCDLLVTGGEFKPPTLSLTGDKAASFFKNMYVDKLFLATGGISPNYELTYPSLSDISVKKAMMKAASTVYLVADSTKIGKLSFASLGSINEVDYFITDSGIEVDTIANLQDIGIKVIIAE